MDTESVLLMLMAVLMVALSGGGLAQMLSTRRQDRLDREKRERDRINPPAVCQCGHGLAFHTPKSDSLGSKCQVEVVETRGSENFEVRFEASGYSESRRNSTQRRACPCQQYVGPVPMAEIHLPQLTSDAVPPRPAAPESE